MLMGNITFPRHLAESGGEGSHLPHEHLKQQGVGGRGGRPEPSLQSPAQVEGAQGIFCLYTIKLLIIIASKLFCLFQAS